MRGGSIFISYASEDRAAAAALAAALDRAKLDVWFDRNELRGGDRYDLKIRQHIRHCDLFVPILSRNTERRRDNEYFRKEWTWARERLPMVSSSRPFMMPIVIDDFPARGSGDVKYYFEAHDREVHILRMPDEKPLDAIVTDFIRAVKQVRMPVAAAAATL
jgi:hypothetical protein